MSALAGCQAARCELAAAPARRSEAPSQLCPAPVARSNICTHTHAASEVSPAPPGRRIQSRQPASATPLPAPSTQDQREVVSGRAARGARANNGHAGHVSDGAHRQQVCRPWACAHNIAAAQAVCALFPACSAGCTLLAALTPPLPPRPPATGLAGVGCRAGVVCPRARPHAVRLSPPTLQPSH